MSLSHQRTKLQLQTGWVLDFETLTEALSERAIQCGELLRSEIEAQICQENLCILSATLNSFVLFCTTTQMNQSHSLLNYEEINQKQIFTAPTAGELNATDASINLTVGTIIDLKTYEEVSRYKIPPQGMALVITREEMKIPDGTIGYTTVKNSLSLKGIMAVNIGIVDNGWSGPISSILINFGKEDFNLKPNDPYLRMTFHQFNKPNISAKQRNLKTYDSRRSYINDRKLEARAYLSETFLVLNKVQKQIKKAVVNNIWKTIGWISLALAVLGVAVSVVVYTFLYSKKVIEYYDKLNNSTGLQLLNSRIDSLMNAFERNERLHQFEIDSISKTSRNNIKKDSTQKVKS